MPETLEKSQTSEPQATAARFRDRLRKRLFADRAANKIVVLGGLAIIFSILAIFLVIFAEVWPLFRGAQVEKTDPVASVPNASTRALGLGSDEYREFVYRIEESGEVRFFPTTTTKSPLRVERVPDLGEAKLTCTIASLGGYHAAGTNDGRVIPFQVAFESKFEDGKRTQIPVLHWENSFSVDGTQKRSVRALAFAVPEIGQTAAALLSEDEIALHTVREGKGLLSDGEKIHVQHSVRLPAGSQARCVLLDNRAEDLFVGTADGRILHYEIPEEGDPVYGGAVLASSGPGVAISSLAFLLGDRTLIVGDAAGAISSWQIEQYGGQERRIQRVYRFASHRQAVDAIATSWRDKGFLTADASGEIILHYGTTGETVARAQGPATLTALYFAPKSDGFFAIDEKGGVSRWELDNPHPETTVQSVFGKIRYEGYQEPEYVWQSTGGTDDFEAKLSLVPLIFGTLKGTFYALLFAVPIALLAALYTSQFMHPRIRAYVKPTVEIMAALPSVVLGFLAGLWIAPQIEKIVPGIFLFPVVLPLTILAALGLWKLLPQTMRGRFPAGAEISLLIPVVLLGSWLAFSLGSAFESAAMQGDYRHWLLETLGLTYDQRNSLVVGFAMGFAVIPIIFTIAEDSLSNVPQHLTAGSLALGATRWQTALRIVLPTGSPGIFSAIMIGFGRAVGETMIVLMATGNTPVMDLSIFSGFRALSANIAVELPEAPEGGTLYRVLFLAALLLFVLTFAVNTVAEIVRLRLRNKYRYL